MAVSKHCQASGWNTKWGRAPELLMRSHESKRHDMTTYGMATYPYLACASSASVPTPYFFFNASSSAFSFSISRFSAARLGW